MTITTAIDQLKAVHRATWESGDYTSVADKFVIPLGTTALNAADPAPGTEVLDVAAGSGNPAIAVAQTGARVTALDLAPSLLAIGRDRARAAGVEIDFVEGDAEALPFEDERFDVALSVVGVQFAPRHEVVARELVRVVRPGGRIVLCSWTPGGFIGQFLKTVAPRMPKPPEGASPPPLWGDEGHVRGLFAPAGVRFEFELHHTEIRYGSAAGFVDYMAYHYGPLVKARERLSQDGTWDELRRDLIALCERHNSATDGFVTRPEYLLARGVETDVQRRLLLALATVAVEMTGAQTAQAATTCAEGGRVLTVAMTEHGDLATLRSTSGGLIIVEGKSGLVSCAGTPTTTFVDTILINDISDDPATPAGNDGATTLSIEEPAGFAPGHTQEPTLPSEVEFLADVKGGQDRLILSGDKPQVIAVGNGGVDWNNDSDADMVGMPFKHLTLAGTNAADHLSGQGGAGIGAPLSTTTTFELLGFDGSDVLRGSASVTGDRLEGGDGPDQVFGEAGDDSIQGDNGDDLLYGGAGADAVRFSGARPVTVDLSETAEQNTGHGRDTLREFEKAYGSAGSDHLIGNAGPNELDGGGGDDILDGRGGADELRGGEGSDTVSYADAPASMTIDLNRADQPTDGDRIYFVENVIGSAFGDTLTAANAPSRIVAGAGTDVVTATGSSVIDVRDGESDRVTCGNDDDPGADTVISDQRSLDAVGSLCQNVDALPERSGTGTPDAGLTFSLGGARKQRLLRQKAVHIKVACPSEPCTTVATSSARCGCGGSQRASRQGPRGTLKLRLTRKQLATVRTALASGRRPSLTVHVVARDRAGNTLRRERRSPPVR